MADDTSDTTQDSTTDAPAEQGSATDRDALGDAGKQALDRMKAERNEAAKQAKALAAELEKVRASQMSEAEKAVAEAEARGRATAAGEFAQRLARSEFVALAARRNAEWDAAAVLDDLNLARYVREDGEPDSEALTAAVERLVPAALTDSRPRGDAGFGPRQPSRPVDDSPRGLIAAGLADTTKPRKN